MITLNKVLRFACLFACLLFLPWTGFAEVPPSPLNTPSIVSPNFSYEIESHHLSVQLDPVQHTIKGEDRVKVHPRSMRGMISILLNSRLRVLRVMNVKTEQSLLWLESYFSDSVKRLDISLPARSGPLSLSIHYEGSIFDPVVKERSLQFVRGDQTTGLIGFEGVYLSSGSYWYPQKPDSLSLFETEVTIPAPFRVITQGELLSEELKGGVWKTRWSYNQPAESLALVAGKYAVKTKIAGGIKVSTYFLPEDEKLSESFLNAAEEYLKIYSDLLGPFPFKKFDIVQNFFSTGYSFPTFTLLAPEAVRQGKEFLRPGALDHEMVHSWWGHSVMNKPGTGNWVEALTTYCTNYYYRELKLGEENARKYRQDSSQKFAIQVPPSKDYPLRQFEEKKEEADGQIGYGKGSMVFHMLRRLVGKEIFFSCLKTLSTRYGGKQASWKEIEEVFEEAGNKPLDDFFSQWLDRPGGPQLKLEGVKSQATPRGFLLSGEVVQEGEPYQLSIPIEVDDGIGKKTLLLEVSRRKTPFSMEVQKAPVTLTVDPNHHLFRKLYPEEVIPGLNAMMEDREKIFVLPEKRDEESRKIYVELAGMAQKARGGRIVSEKDLTEEEIQHASLMLLGESWKNPVLAKTVSALPPSFVSKEGKFHLEGESVKDGDESVLLTLPHPGRTGKWVTLYFGASPAALTRAPYVFFYGWDSYLLFKKGRPVKRGDLMPQRSFVTHSFLPSKEHSGTAPSP